MLAGAMVEERERCNTAKAVHVNLEPHVHNRVASKVPAQQNNTDILSRYGICQSLHAHLENKESSYHKDLESTNSYACARVQGGPYKVNLEDTCWLPPLQSVAH
jgi:hypothetical protein